MELKSVWKFEMYRCYVSNDIRDPCDIFWIIWSMFSRLDYVLPVHLSCMTAQINGTVDLFSLTSTLNQYNQYNKCNRYAYIMHID